MDCGLALRPLSCDVTGKGPTGHGRGGHCGLRKAEEDRALHPCHRRACACAHRLDGIRARNPDGLSRPVRALHRHARIHARRGGVAGREQRRLADRPPLSLLEPRRPRHPPRACGSVESEQLRLEQRRPCEHDQRGAVPRTRRHADHPLSALLRAGLGARGLPGDLQAEAGDACSVHRGRDDEVQRRAHLGRLERAQPAFVPEPAVPEREAATPRSSTSRSSTRRRPSSTPPGAQSSPPRPRPSTSSSTARRTTRAR